MGWLRRADLGRENRKMKRTSPPKIAERILSILSSSKKTGILGDTEEEYRMILLEKSRFRADMWYVWQIFLPLPFLIRLTLYWRFIMFENYLKIALRNIKRNKGYSFINVAGLALGMACCLFILFYVLYEFSYDTFHEDSDRIYRVAMEFRAKDQPVKYGAVTPPTVAPAILDKYAEVEDAARITWANGIVKYGEKQFFEDGILYADQSFFNVFTFPIIKGNPETALKEPYTAVLTESTAEKYFGREDPVGKTISINYQRDYEITGVVEDVPPNSHFTFDLLFSFAPIEESLQNAPIGKLWFSHSYYTYIKTRSENPSPAFIEGVYNLSANLIGDFENRVGFHQRFFLQPLKDIYLTSNLGFEPGSTGKKAYLYYFIAIAVFILIIASINFVNLSTARSTGRAREVGIRKVAGAEKKQLIIQFLGEAFFTTIISAGIAVIIILFSLPYFRAFTGKDVELNFNSGIVLCLILTPLAVGLLAGSYPAFFLSAFHPIDTLKGAFGHTKKGRKLRKGLVVFQFTISILLIVSTIIVSRQLHFMRNRDLGFDKEQIVVLSLRGSGEARQKYDVLKNEFMKHSTIVSASASYTVPGREPSSRAMLPEGFTGDQWQTFLINWADYDYLETYKIELAAGRDFLRDFETDKEEAFILNEAAVISLGWNSPEDGIGKNWNLGNRRKGKVIGVTKDYHFNSLHQKISPLVIHLDPSYFVYLSLRFTTDSISETLSFIEETWKELVPDEPFSYFFLNEDFDRQYRAEEQLQAIVSLFTFMGMVIACLGLFALVSFSAEQRKKEIGIRKVLGSANHKIVFLLVKDFLILVLVANVLAIPAGWLSMNKWLQNFAFRTNMSIWIFLLSGSAAFAIALLTVSFQTIKAATANPVDSLRYE
jgi:putative ABC transport system permease protein